MKNIWIDKKEFREVPCCPGIWISRDGEMYSTRCHSRYGKGRYGNTPFKLKPRPDKDGYLKSIRLDNSNSRLSVHRAVLLAWIGPCPIGHQCRHLNGNKKDNNLDNLKWGSASENIDDRGKHGNNLKGERNAKAKLTPEIVIKIREDFKHKPITIIHSEYPHVSRVSIYCAIIGYTWSHLPGAHLCKSGRTQKGYRSGIRYRNRSLSCYSYSFRDRD